MHAEYFEYEKPCMYPDSKDHGANMGPAWILSALGGPHAGPMKLAIRLCMGCYCYDPLVWNNYRQVSNIRRTLVGN